MYKPIHCQVTKFFKFQFKKKIRSHTHNFNAIWANANKC